MTKIMTLSFRNNNWWWHISFSTLGGEAMPV